jgi:hypothetical protein
MNLEEYLEVRLPIPEQIRLVFSYKFVERFCRDNDFTFVHTGTNYSIKYCEIPGAERKFFTTIFEAQVWIEGLIDRQKNLKKDVI